MNDIVACVPNFSEGRNKETIAAIAAAIRGTDGCRLLDVDPGASTNRTVYTFVGAPGAVAEGAMNAARVAAERIDMRRHRGEHPRFGAMDVCPFVPVRGVTMDDCVDIAVAFGRRLADELSVPVFLYEAAAAADYRRALSDVREGEYEGLGEKMKDPRWRPDFGPPDMVPAWGATAVGARSFLIAYNVNILGTPNQAHRIALNLREAGRGDDAPGRLPAVKGMGWFVDEYNLAQVTVNLTDYRVTGLHTLFEAVREEAAQLNVGVAGSEIVGVVPLEAIRLAADYYIEKEGLFIYQEDQMVRLVADRLGLNAVAPFHPAEKIIEYIVAEAPETPLAAMSTGDFIRQVAARTSAPGGGSVAAATAAMGAGLGAMAAKLTYGVRKFEAVDGEMRAVIPVLHKTAERLIDMIDADTAAYNAYMEGIRMPKDTEAQRTARRKKMQAGLKTAATVPLETMRIGDGAWTAMEGIARYGSPNFKSDVQVGARSLETGIWGAYQNVRINVTGIKDEAFKAAVLAEADALAHRARDCCERVLDILEGKTH